MSLEIVSDHGDGDDNTLENDQITIQIVDNGYILETAETVQVFTNKVALINEIRSML